MNAPHDDPLHGDLPFAAAPFADSTQTEKQLEPAAILIPATRGPLKTSSNPGVPTI